METNIQTVHHKYLELKFGKLSDVYWTMLCKITYIALTRNLFHEPWKYMFMAGSEKLEQY